MRPRLVMITGLLFVFLAACSGSGGSPFHASIASISPEKPVTGVSATFVGAASFPPGSELTYSWTFGDGGAATGTQVSYTYARTGSFEIILKVTDGAGHSVSVSRAITVLGPPTTPVISASPDKPVPGDSVTLATSSTDPQGGAISYTWAFDDGGTATGTSVTHVFAAEALHVITVTATDPLNLSSTGRLQLDVAYPPPTTPLISGRDTLYINQVLQLSGSATDPSGFPITYSWSFGDGTTAQGTEISHAWTAPGTYPVTLTATNSDDKSSAAGRLVQVLEPASPLVGGNTLSPLCSGPLCGAVDASTYSGSGIGAWMYNNTSADAATLDLKLLGVPEGATVSLIFTNGGTTTAASPPSAGAPSASSAAAAARAIPRLLDRQTLRRQVEQAAHTHMLLANHETALKLLSSPRRPLPAVRAAAAPRPHAAPPVGTTRTWTDLWDGSPGVPYSASVIHTCPLPDGRNGVFWLDPAASTAGGVTDEDLSRLETTYCGEQGGYARLTGLLGDVWGPDAAKYSNLILDTDAAPLDVNIVILGVPDDTGWGGYFAANNTLTNVQGSNNALAFLVNGSNLHVSAPYYASLLLHESTHMINWYQKSIVRDTGHDTWLEESSAMMTEDIVAPAVNDGYNTTVDSVSSYSRSGGAVSYINWEVLSGADYDMGASFGAFLNRRYGLSIYQQLVTSCDDGASVTSYGCMDSLIAAHGGVGFADELARLGATIFGGVAPGSPWGLGFSATAAGVYTLQGLIPAGPSVAAALDEGFTATTHTYQVDRNPPGSTCPTPDGGDTRPCYQRAGIVIPAGTSLIVIVRP